MLGWDVLLLRGECAIPEDLIAKWRTSANGLDWVDELVKAGRATDHGGNGYPQKYTATASVLLGFLTRGLPDSSNPLTLGDDYVVPAGWRGCIDWRPEVLKLCAPNDVLVLEAWDLS